MTDPRCRDSESLYEYDLEGSILFLFLKPDVFVYLGEDYPSVFGVYDDTAESIPDNFDFRKSGQRITFAPTLLQLPRSLLCQQIADSSCQRR